MAKVLVINGERSVRNALKERLGYEGHQVDMTENLQDGMLLCEQTPFDIVFCDHALMEAGRIASDLVRLKGKGRAAVIMIAAQASMTDAVEYVRNGAYDFLSKPIDMNRLFESVRRVVAEREEGVVDRTAACTAAGVSTRTVSRQRVSRVEEIVGASQPIQHVKNLIEKVAPSSARVLVTGANGTGKELVARWLHEKSNRANGPFVEVNCAAIPGELIESELFGHEKGAFTSAVKQRKGKFEQAHGGTLFLDEIGDMSLSAQAKVLRALQENRISRVGSDKDIEVDVRVVAATNKNLKDEIAKGNFREDLYHRLSVIVIHVPSLNDRADDIPLLVDHFVDKISAEYGVSPKKVDPQAVAELRRLDWTGNIRELRNVIERLIILSEKNITLNDVKVYAEGLV
ncbi:MAG: sigma-54-dependent Fis family transcriptional regulator [Rikenellaceae bacterium]|nr:sigma-54-dependent Fis family transcriptional regulator [Rikenellaceae bacterium]